MMFLVALILTTLAILYMLTTLALSASGQLRHPILIATGFVVMLILGLALLAE